MAHTPQGASLVKNAVSRAPGFRMENVIVMAGIPRVMQAMFDNAKHQLVGGRPTLSRTVACHLPEGIIAKGLGALQAQYPDLDIGSYPFYRRGEFGTSLVLRGRDPDRLALATKDVVALVKDLGGDPAEE
jgi:molybdopterin-biosynthesis enzyme MoeA-like protein